MQNKKTPTKTFSGGAGGSSGGEAHIYTHVETTHIVDTCTYGISLHTLYKRLYRNNLCFHSFFIEIFHSAHAVHSSVQARPKKLVHLAYEMNRSIHPWHAKLVYVCIPGSYTAAE